MKIGTRCRSVTIIKEPSWSNQLCERRIWLCFKLQMSYKRSRHDVDEVAYLILDRIPWIKNLMSLCGVREFLIAEQFLNNTSYRISLFFGKVRIASFLDHDSSSFISVIHDIDLLPLRTFIGFMFRLFTPIILANVRLDIWILLALCSSGGRCCHRGFNHLLGWRLVNYRGIRLNPFATWWLINWHLTPEKWSSTL